MTREDITKQFPEATKEQIDALLNIHSADIGKAKGDAAKLQGDLKAVQDQLTTANATIAEMEKSKGDVAALQKQIDDYKAADDARKQAEAAAQARQALLSRMDKVLGERKLIHERMRELIADDFDKEGDAIRVHEPVVLTPLSSTPRGVTAPDMTESTVTAAEA